VLMALFKKKAKTEPEEIDLSAIDRESKYKIFSPRGEMLLNIVLTCFALFQLYASISNKVPLQILRYTHLGFAICLAFLIYPATKNADRKKLPWYDCVLSALFFCVVAYFIISSPIRRFGDGYCPDETRRQSLSPCRFR
ncbi:MAG: hypothetical protein J6A76_03385, partial [Oscillospiraceae bacterium]|nr:hypothetical protein [Oscillospiraceae bacterium]